MKTLPTGDALLKRAKELGVITGDDGNYIVPGLGNVPFQASDQEIQRRVIEAERHMREHRLWVVAVIAAIASALSALAAWIAVVCK